MTALPTSSCVDVEPLGPDRISGNAADGATGPAFDRWDVFAALAFVAGMATRLVSTFPLHAWWADQDALLSGMTALRVLRGEWPAFFSYARLGALESWLHAASFSALGVSRTATAVVPLLAAAATLVVFHALGRSLLGRHAACLALAVLALPSPAFLFWTYTPNSYGLSAFFVVSTLYFSDRLARRGGAVPTAALLGFAGGLGWWNSLQTVAGLLPAAGWVLVLRPRALISPRLAGAMAAGFLVGAAPWIMHNVANDWESIRGTQLVRAVGSRQGVVENAAYFACYSVPELFVAPDPGDGARPPNAVQTALQPVVLAAHLAGAAWLLLLGLRWALARHWGAREPPPGWVLLAATAFTMAALNIASEAGAARGLTVRYVLPCYFAGAAALALVGSRARGGPVTPFAVSAVLAVCVWNVAGIPLPGCDYREAWRLQDAGESQTLRLLRAHGVRVAWGHHFFVYPLNFLSQEAIRGIPYQRSADFQGYTERLPASPAPWALVSRTDGELEAWAERAGVRGDLHRFEGGYRVFLPEPNPFWHEPPARTHARLLFAFDGSRRDP